MTSAVLDNTKIATEAGSITVYNFAAQTGEYTGSSDAVDAGYRTVEPPCTWLIWQKYRRRW
ncbi:hypothetical protein ACV80T_19640 [Enterobacter hormaechei]